MLVEFQGADSPPLGVEVSEGSVSPPLAVAPSPGSSSPGLVLARGGTTSPSSQASVASGSLAPSGGLSLGIGSLAPSALLPSPYTFSGAGRVLGNLVGREDVPVPLILAPTRFLLKRFSGTVSTDTHTLTGGPKGLLGLSLGTLHAPLRVLGVYWGSIGSSTVGGSFEAFAAKLVRLTVFTARLDGGISQGALPADGGVAFPSPLLLGANEELLVGMIALGGDTMNVPIDDSGSTTFSFVGQSGDDWDLDTIDDDTQWPTAGGVHTLADLANKPGNLLFWADVETGQVALDVWNMDESTPEEIQLTTPSDDDLVSWVPAAISGKIWDVVQAPGGTGGFGVDTLTIRWALAAATSAHPDPVSFQLWLVPGAFPVPDLSTPAILAAHPGAVLKATVDATLLEADITQDAYDLGGHPVTVYLVGVDSGGGLSRARGGVMDLIPPRPLIPSVTNLGDGRVDLTWGDVTGGGAVIAGYHVVRSLSVGGGGHATRIEVTSGSILPTTFSDRTGAAGRRPDSEVALPAAGITYDYFVHSSIRMANLDTVPHFGTSEVSEILTGTRVIP